MSTDQLTATTSLHNVTLYTGSQVAQNSNERLVILRWKQTKEMAKQNKQAFADRCVSVPKLFVTVNVPTLQEALTDALNDMQEALVRSLVEERLAKEPSLPHFTLSADQISYNAVAEFHKATATSDRLTKEKIQSWFDASLSDNLGAAIISKLNLSDREPTEQERKKVIDTLATFKDKLSSLSAPNPGFNETILEQLNKAVALAEESDITNTLRAKITKLLQPKEIDIAINL